MLNFSWWVNRKDRYGKNLFEGGFLGWITSGASTAARRCPPVATWSRPTARHGCHYSVRTCSRISIELAAHNPAFEDMATQVR